MLMLHHRHRISYGAEGRWQDGLLLDNGFLHPFHIREQDHLLFHHMCGQFLSQASECLAKLEKFGMAFSMDRANLIEKRAETSNLFARVLMVCILDVGDQVS